MMTAYDSPPDYKPCDGEWRRSPFSGRWLFWTHAMIDDAGSPGFLREWVHKKFNEEVSFAPTATEHAPR